MLHIATTELVNSVGLMSKASRIERIIEVAKLRRDELRLKMEEKKKQLDIVDEVIAAFEEMRSKISLETFDKIIEGFEFPDLDKSFQLSEEKASTPKREVISSSLSPDILANESRQVLLEMGRPLKRGMLVRELEAKGMRLPGKDKNKNLGTVLWRHPRMFVSIEGMGYWVKGVPLEGVYDPERDDEPLPKTTLVRTRAG